jgi:putative tricarboxylic transport membrane protein
MAGEKRQDEREDSGARPAFSVHRTDLLIAAIILSGAALLFYETTRFDEIPVGLAQNVPPELFPQLLLVLIAGMALFLPFEHIQKRREGIDLDTPRSDRIRPVTWLTAAVLFGVVLLVQWLGTALAMVLACAALPVLWGERRLWLVALFAVLLPLAVTLLFAGLLDVNFIPGITGPLFR